METRVKKYIAKGFDIQLSQYWNEIHSYLRSEICKPNVNFYNLLSLVDDGTIDIQGYINSLK